MRLKRGSEYGIHGVLYLAMRPKDKTTLLNEVAEVLKIPKSYLSKIFQTYTKAGILKSFRGAKRGFALTRPPEKITLKELVESFEGKLLVEGCSLGRDDCPQNKHCSISKTLRKAQSAMDEVLEKTSLKDLMMNFKKI